MKNSEILNVINELEKNFPVKTWTIDKIHIWPIIRMELMFQMRDDEESKEKYDNKNLKARVKKLVRRVLNWLQVFFSDYKFNAYKFKQEKVFFSSHMADRNIKIQENLFYDHNMDYLKEYIEKTHKLKVGGFELVGDTAVVRRTSKSFTTFPLEIYAMVMVRIGKHKEAVLPQYNELVAFLTKKAIKINLNKKNIEQNVKAIIIFSDLIEKIIKNSNIKLAFCMCYYSTFQFAYILACKRLNIPVIDVQHGIAGGMLHPAYAGWCNLPKGGYELLPNYFWCWSEADFQAIDEWSRQIDIHKPILGGHMEVSAWLDSENNLVQYYDQLLKNKLIMKDKKLVLVSLQTGILIPRWVIVAIENSRENIIWLIRFHPGQSRIEREQISRQFESCKNIEMELANEIPLYALLRVVDMNITDFSTVIVDAINFGIKSISYGLEVPKLMEMFKSEVSKGYLMFARNEEELLILVESTNKPRTIPNATTIDSKLILDDLVRKFCL